MRRWKRKPNLVIADLSRREGGKPISIFLRSARGGLTPAETPRIDAEFLFRQPEPVHYLAEWVAFHIKHLMRHTCSDQAGSHEKNRKKPAICSALMRFATEANQVQARIVSLVGKAPYADVGVAQAEIEQLGVQGNARTVNYNRGVPAGRRSSNRFFSKEVGAAHQHNRQHDGQG
jgi:hypothetical protein